MIMHGRKQLGGWADDCIQARWRDGGSNVPTPPKHTKCGRVGHVAQKCWGNLEKPGPGTKSEEETGGVRSEVVSVKKESSNRPGVRCFNCKKMGHLSFECPDRALLCRGYLEHEVTVRGEVEGRMVGNIVLQHNVAHRMFPYDGEERAARRGRLWRDGHAVTVRCAHGDTVLYPL